MKKLADGQRQIVEYRSAEYANRMTPTRKRQQRFPRRDRRPAADVEVVRDRGK